MNSEPHWALLVKILNEAHVAQDISMEGFGGIINNITANNYLTFADEEIPVKGRGHNRALHVSVKYLDHIVAKVLIENVSQPTLLRASEARLTGVSSKGGKCAESPPTFICGKRRKNRRKLVIKNIPNSGVVFTFEEGISTPHVSPKGQQP